MEVEPRKKRHHLKVGDLFETEVEGKTYFIQYLGAPPSVTAPLVRVFKDRSLNPDSILFKQVFVGILPPIRQGLWRLFRRDTDIFPPIDPVLNFSIITAPPNILPDEWTLITSTERRPLGRILPPEYYDYATTSVTSWELLSEDIARGEQKTLARFVVNWGNPKD